MAPATRTVRRSHHEIETDRARRARSSDAIVEAVQKYMVSTRAHTDPKLPRVILDAPSWIPSEKIPRWAVIATIVAIFPITALITVVPYLLGWLDSGSLQGLGYLGIFLINFFATAAWDGA